MVASNDVSVPVVPLNPGSMDTNMVANGRGFSFDSGTFTSPEQSDLYVKDLDVPLSPGVPGAPYFTFYSNGDNLALASSTGLAGFANLREVPTAGFASSVKVKSDDVIVVKTAAGNYVKLLVFGLGFSRLQGTPVNFVTFSWQLQPSGGTRFDY